MTTILYLCPLGQQQRQWRIEAAPPSMNLIMRRTTEISRDEVLSLLPTADVLITERRGDVDGEMIAAGAKLKLIQRIGSLYHDIDLDAARARGVPVAYAPIRGTTAVAEHVMLQLLALLRRAMPLQRVVRTSPQTFGQPRRTTEDVFAFNWSGQTRVALLIGKTVGIVGFGEIGAELARFLKSWRVNLLYNSRQRLPEFIESELGATYASADDVLRHSDIVVCLLPYFAETDQWLNAERIGSMKRGAYLAVAGSGSVVDEAAAAQALRDGHLAGAAFDTYEWEPLRQDSPLAQLAADPDANVFLTPHIGSCNDASRGYAVFFDNCLRLARGEPIQGRVA